MKNEILKEMINLGGSGVSFVELMRIPGAKGDKTIGINDFNLIAWSNVSGEFQTSFLELESQGLIKPTITSYLVYMVDGESINLPIAKKVRKYRTPRWLPVVYGLTPEGRSEAKKLFVD